MTRIWFVKTQAFDNQFNQGRLDVERDWFHNYVWHEINDAANTKVYPDSSLDLSENDIKARAYEAEDMLQSTTEAYFDYNLCDCCLVLDHYASNSLAGYSTNIGGAGAGSQSKTALISYDGSFYAADYSLAVPARRYIGHEIGHVFGGEHYQGGITSADEITFMWESEANSLCFDNGWRNTVQRQYAGCAESTINSTANDV